MPRSKDPVAELEAFKSRQADLAKRAKKLEADAAMHLGRKLMASGLHRWDGSDLDEVLAALSNCSADDAKRKLAKASSMPVTEERVNAPPANGAV